MYGADFLDSFFNTINLPAQAWQGFNGLAKRRAVGHVLLSNVEKFLSGNNFECEVDQVWPVS